MTPPDNAAPELTPAADQSARADIADIKADLHTARVQGGRELSCLRHELDDLRKRLAAISTVLRHQLPPVCERLADACTTSKNLLDGHDDLPPPLSRHSAAAPNAPDNAAHAVADAAADDDSENAAPEPP